MITTSSIALLASPFAGWIVAQFLKFIFTLRKDGISLQDAIQSGGMPSSHSAISSSLATAVGVTQGISSVSFAITVALRRSLYMTHLESAAQRANKRSHCSSWLKRIT